MSPELRDQVDRLRTQGIFVVLRAGRYFLIDEKFLFDDRAEAEEFFEQGFAAWELSIDDDDESAGFEEVSLYIGGCLVASKSCPPSKRLDAADDDFALDFLTGEWEIISPKWRCPDSSKFPTDSESSKDLGELDE
jgi:hypothetical protein